MQKRDSVFRPSGELECNYADNYYGDQVCVLKKS